MTLTLLQPLAEAGAAMGPALQVALGFGAGLLLGLAHFASLGAITRCFLAGRALRALMLQLGRFALLATVLVLLAGLGAAALLASLPGLLLARALLLRRARSPR